ncbi:MAG TPA: FtsQ-type POTRA domain-containing protein [Abditibacteriaceae bacterium]
MQPIRGPIDYNRYPPRARRRNSAPRDDEHTLDASTQHETLDTEQPDADPQPRSRAARRRRATDSSLDHTSDVAQDNPQDSAVRRRASRHAARRTAPRSRAWDTTQPVDDDPFQPHPDPADQSVAGDLGEQDEALQTSSRKRGWRSGHTSHKGAPNNRVPLWKRMRRWCGILLIIFFLEFGVALLTAPHFSIERVEAEGLGITSPQDVIGVQSTLVGQNWLRARLQNAATNLETLPTVRQARVTRDFRWPPQVTVHIEERQPFARVGAGDDWWIVDRSGMPFRRADLREPQDASLYAVTGPTLKPQIGTLLPTKTWQPVREFAQSLTQAQEKGTRWALRRLYFDRHGFASLRLTGGAHDEMLIQMGADHWSKKLQRARQALTYFEATGRRAAVLNLISYSMPTWTPRPEQDTDAAADASPDAIHAAAANIAAGAASTRPTASSDDSAVSTEAAATT